MFSPVTKVFKTILHRFAQFDRRRLGILNIVTVGVFFLCGLASIVAVQIDLLSPRVPTLNAELFGRLLTVHGLAMIYTVLIPLFPGVFGLLVVPASVGARDNSLRKSDIVAWVLLAIGGATTITSLLVGAYSGGSQMHMPPASYSPAFQALLFGLTLSTTSVFLSCLGIVRTVLSPAARTVTFSQLPLLSWFFLFGAVLLVLSAPVRVVSFLLPMLRHSVNWSWLPDAGGPGTIGFDRMNELFLTPAICAIGLFALGIAFEVLAGSSVRKYSSRTMLVGAAAVIGSIGCMIPLTRMVYSPDSALAVTAEAYIKLLVILPAIVIFRSFLVRVFYIQRPVKMSVILVYLGVAFGFVAGVLAALVAQPSIAEVLGRTYFTTALVHVAAIGCAGLFFAAGLIHWWKPWFEHDLPRTSFVSAMAVGVGGLVIFAASAAMLGTKGLPRALQIFPPEFAALHLSSSIGTFGIAVSFVFGMIAVVIAFFNRRETKSDDLGQGEFPYFSMTQSGLKQES
jgi:cytochrome c oxidase subunit 1